MQLFTLNSKIWPGCFQGTSIFALFFNKPKIKKERKTEFRGKIQFLIMKIHNKK